MSANLDISTFGSGQPVYAEFSVIVVVRPSRGRSVELTLPSNGRQSVVVAPGDVTVDVTHSSGRTVSIPLALVDGETRAVPIEVAGSPNESRRWLLASRESANTPQHIGFAAVRRAPATDWVDHGNTFLKSLSPAGPVSCDELHVELYAPNSSARIVTDQTHPSSRIIHVEDSLYPGPGLFGPGTHPPALILWHPTLTQERTCTLPSPFDAGGVLCEVHVALTPVERDAFPDVQVVPASGVLAPLVGFLERQDQRSLSALREDIVQRASRALYAKAANPLGAAIGLAALLRMGAVDTVRRWSRNLWKWFPGLPDGGALHAAVLLRAPRDTKTWRSELRAAALDAAHAGVPVLSDALLRLRDVLILLGSHYTKDEEIIRASKWCDTLVRAMDPQAVFTTLTLPRGAYASQDVVV